MRAAQPLPAKSSSSAGRKRSARRAAGAEAVVGAMNRSGEHHTANIKTAVEDQGSGRWAARRGYIKEAGEEAHAGVGNSGLVGGAEGQAAGCPGRRQAHIHLGMELQAVSAAAGPERLLPIQASARQQRRSRWKRKRVLMPVDDRQRAVAAGAEDRIFEAFRGQDH